MNPSVEVSASIEDAIGKSLDLMGKEDILVVFGSLSFLQLAEKAVEERGKKDE